MRELEAKHPSPQERGRVQTLLPAQVYNTEAEEWEMKDLEHISLNRGGEFSPSCRPRYNRG
jgi:hypothetical protein